MRPETCCGSEGRAACSSSRTASLHIELPKVFWPQVLEVFLQLLRGHLLGWLRERFRRRLAFLEQKRREQTLLSEDGRLESQRDGDAVGRPYIAVDRFGVARDVQLRVKRAVLHFGDVDPAQRAAHADDEILA